MAISVLGSFYGTQKKGVPPGGVRYPPISEPLIYYGFDLVRWFNFKGFWLPVKQVLNINKKIKTFISLFSLSPVSRLRLYPALFASKPSNSFALFLKSFALFFSLNKTLKSLIPHLRRNPQNPQSPAHPQTLRARRTHNLKSEALLLIQSTGRHRSLAYSLPIHIQISGALISNPTRRRFISSRTTRRCFFSSILNRRRHPQYSGSLFTYD